MKLFKELALENQIILSLDKKKRLQISLISILTSLIIMLAPFVILCNLLIFIDYIFLTTLGLALVLFLFLYLDRVFYLIMLKLEFKLPKEVHFKANYLVYLLGYFLVMAILYLVAAIILGVVFVW